MQTRLIKLLHEQELAYKEKGQQIGSFEENPLTLFTDLQHNQHLIPNTLSAIDEKFLLDYQDWQYTLVQQALIDAFNFEGIEIRWETTVFPSPFYLLRNGYPIALIHPYERSFTALPSESVVETLEEFEAIQRKRLGLWEDYQMERIRLANPFVGESESFTNTLKVAMTKKKRQKTTLQEVERLKAAHDQLSDDIQRLNLKLVGMHREHNILLYDIDKLYNQLRHRLNLSYVDGHSQAFADTYDVIRRMEDQAESNVNTQQYKSMETEQY